MVTEVINWLLNGDPVIRYQVHRDLLESGKEDLARSRLQIEIEDGWFQQISSFQGEDMTWGHHIADHAWKGTLWVLNLLRRFSVPYEIVNFKEAVNLLINEGLQRDGGVNYDTAKNHSEVCESGIVLSLLSYFKVKSQYREAIFEFLIENQMTDGGWNCRRLDGATHSSFHTTIMVLEGLRDYSLIDHQHLGTVSDLMFEGHEFLLEHQLFRSHTTYRVATREILHFAFPPRLNYDVLTAMDYFQSINHRYDNRFKDAINLIRAKEENGKWLLEHEHIGEFWIKMEELHDISRWNTLRALRVLRWWKKVTRYQSV
ncbi:MAG: hypothetical protein IH840_01360 [Candidatus Heimdallarchaeota archaeon]|nr:hypothetical protein [Candidatus Heimdallarchaeota archaeon]